MPRSFFVTILVLASSIAIADDSNPAASAARSRQENAQSVLLEYRQVTRAINPGKEGQPGKEISAKADNRIVFRGEQARVEDNNSTKGMFGSLNRNQRIDAFDGELIRSLIASPGGKEKSSRGFIYAKSDRLPIKPPDAVVLAFRGVQPAFGYPTLAEIQPTGKTETLDGRPCPEFALTTPARVTRYWLDPSIEHLVRRIRIEERGKPIRTTDVNYRRDPNLGWLITGWKNEHPTPEGPIGLIEECTVTKLELNSSVNDAEFTIEFPVGAKIDDHRNKSHYIVNENSQLIEVDAEGKEIVPWSTSLKEWLSKNPLAIGLMGLGLVAILGTLFLYRRARRSKALSGT